MSGRVLVTGGAGFIGRHAVPLLRARGFEVHAPTHAEADLLAPGVAAALMARLRPTHLMHLAWNAKPGRFWSAPDNLDWVAASLALHRAFASAGGRRAVFAGSCAEYDWSHALLDEATTPCSPATLYGTAKDALRRLVLASPEGASLAWGRIFFLYGPGEPPGRLLPDVISALLAGAEALCGDCLVERDFLHVADVAAALVALLACDVTGSINIASGCCVPLRRLVDEAARQLGRPDLLRYGARRGLAVEPARLAAATRRLREEVGFAPRFGLQDGLADVIARWR